MLEQVHQRTTAGLIYNKYIGFSQQNAPMTMTWKKRRKLYNAHLSRLLFPDRVNAFLNASGGEIWKTTTNRTVEYCGFSTRSKRNGSIKWFGREMEETNKTPKLAWWMLLIGAANNHLRDCRRQREREKPVVKWSIGWFFLFSLLTPLYNTKTVVVLIILSVSLCCLAFSSVLDRFSSTSHLFILTDK